MDYSNDIVYWTIPKNIISPFLLGSGNFKNFSLERGVNLYKLFTANIVYMDYELSNISNIIVIRVSVDAERDYCKASDLIEG
jgi:hypothetical protein